jgi:FkbM family methyltransferase
MQRISDMIAQTSVKPPTGKVPPARLHDLTCAQCLKLTAFRRMRALAEPELRLVPRLVRFGSMAVDVGSHSGTYAFEMARAGRVPTIAFEPNPGLHPCRDGARSWPYLLLPVALSDRCGSAVMRVPVTGGVHRYGRSSISVQNRFCNARPHEELIVATRSLDSLGLPRIGFVKIDVEGHELAVLRGAETIIERDRPNFLVETEQRHNPASPAAVFRFFRRRGYRGFFLSSGRLQRLSALDQNCRELQGRKINNFIFLPKSGRSPGAELTGI